MLNLGFKKCYDSFLFIYFIRECKTLKYQQQQQQQKNFYMFEEKQCGIIKLKW